MTVSTICNEPTLEPLLDAVGWRALAELRLRRLEQVNEDNKQLRLALNKAVYDLQHSASRLSVEEDMQAALKNSLFNED